jgi:hypothetical protein
MATILREQHIEQVLATHATFTHTDGFGVYTTLYQPMNYQDEHGTVVAHLVEINTEENTIYTSRYYSRAWAYWNFKDVMGDDFALANYAMTLEGDYIDHTINIAEEALEVIKSGSIPHSNEYWQALVVRLAYNAITNVEEFVNMVRSGKHTAEQVQQMLDLAAGAVLSGNQFHLQDLKTIAA